MTTPIWQQLEDLSDKLGIEGKLTSAQMKLMRSCSMQLENWYVAVQEMREERDLAREDCTKYHQAMMQVGEVMRIGSQYLVKESHEKGDQTFARDFSSHINIMGGLHKDPDYLKGGKPSPHIDMRKSKKTEKE